MLYQNSHVQLIYHWLLITNFKIFFSCVYNVLSTTD